MCWAAGASYVLVHTPPLPRHAPNSKLLRPPVPKHPYQGTKAGTIAPWGLMVCTLPRGRNPPSKGKLKKVRQRRPFLRILPLDSSASFRRVSLCDARLEHVPYAQSTHRMLQRALFGVKKLVHAGSLIARTGFLAPRWLASPALWIHTNAPQSLQACKSTGLQPGDPQIEVASSAPEMTRELTSCLSLCSR